MRPGAGKPSAAAIIAITTAMLPPAESPMKTTSEGAEVSSTRR